MLGEVSEADKHKDKIDRELRGSPASLVEWVILAYVAGQLLRLLLLFYPLPPSLLPPSPTPHPHCPSSPGWSFMLRQLPIANIFAGSFNFRKKKTAQSPWYEEREWRDRES